MGNSVQGLSFHGKVLGFRVGPLHLGRISHLLGIGDGISCGNSLTCGGVEQGMLGVYPKPLTLNSGVHSPGLRDLRLGSAFGIKV